jgi:hypothetical protein
MAGFVPASGAVSADDIGRIYTKNSAPSDVKLSDNRYRDTVRIYPSTSEIKFSDFRGRGWGMQRSAKKSQGDPSYYDANSNMLFIGGNVTDGTVQPYHFDERIDKSPSGVWYENATTLSNGIRRTNGDPDIQRCNYRSDSSSLTGFDSGGYIDLRCRGNVSYYTAVGFNFYVYTGPEVVDFTVNYRLQWGTRQNGSSGSYPALSIYALGNINGYLDGTRTTLASKSESAQFPGTYENGTLNVTSNASYPYTTIVFSVVCPPDDYVFFTSYDYEGGAIIGNLYLDLRL